MSNLKNLKSNPGIEKLKDMVAKIDICLFCTNLENHEYSDCRPMGAQQVDDEGNIWFFSGLHSTKNEEIQKNPDVQLFFSHPGKSSYLVVNGNAEIIISKTKTEELWSPLVKTWFKEGKDDPEISLIKVNTKNAYYWDTDGNRMINFFKMVASVATGTTLVTGDEGAITV